MKQICSSVAAIAAVLVAGSAYARSAPQGQTPVTTPNAPTDASRTATAAEPSAKGSGMSAPSDQAGDLAGLQDIVVTATRRSANLQTVPATVSAFQASTLAAQGIKSVADINRAIPGLIVTRNATSSNLYLRGVGTQSVGFTTEAPVAVYIDGLYLPNPGSSVFSFNNIERVEVLKGPQGTLYGRNTTGGLIQVITRDPSRDPHVDASVGYANYETFTANFYGSTPLTDTLAANIAVTHTGQKDGWGTNAFLGTDILTYHETGVQGKILWEPSSGTRISLRGLYDHVNTDQGVSVGIYPGAVAIDGTTYLGEYTIKDRRDGRAISDFYSTSLKIDQDVGFANLMSLTGYIDSKGNSQVSQLGIPGNPVNGRSGQFANFPGHSRTFSQELQLSSNNNSTSRFEWIAGLYYYHDNTRAGSEVFGTCVGTTCAGAVPTRTIGFLHTRSYAAYGEGTFKIRPRTRITLGVRYTKDQKSISGYAEPYPGLPNSPATLPATAIPYPGAPYAGNPNGIATSTSYSRPTFKAVLAQDLSESIHAYISYNRGFRSGGYNPTNFANAATKPEILDAFEAGIKSDLFDRLLRVNISGFHYNYSDIQLRTTAPPAPPGAAITYNAAEGRVNGMDADVTLAPARGLQITGSLELLYTHFSNFPNTICTVPRVIAPPAVLGGNASVACDNTGHRFANAPQTSFTLGAVYTIPTSIGSIALAANDAYKSRFFWDPSNRTSQEPYHLVNASVTWTTPKKDFDVQVFVRNLTKSRYFLLASEAANDVYSPGVPRTYGATIGFHY